MAHEIVAPEPLHQLLLEALRWFEGALERTLALQGHRGITQARAQLLAQVDAGGTGPSELARRLGISRQATHKHVADLVGRGLLRIEPDPGNLSARRATLTPEGAQALAAVQHAHAALEADLARRLGRIRVRALRTTLEAAWGETRG